MALEDRQAGGLARELGDELDGAGPRPDHADACAAQVAAVVPLGRVEGAPGEGAGARQVRHGGLVQLAGGEDDRGRLVAAAVGGLDRPAARRVVPRAGGDLRVRDDLAVDAVVAGDAAQVLEDLGLRRAEPRPVAPRGVGEGVEVARDVAGRARVGVGVPGAAELGVALEQHDVAEPVALELDGGGDAAEARPDDHDLLRHRVSSHRHSMPSWRPACRRFSCSATPRPRSGAPTTTCCPSGAASRPSGSTTPCAPAGSPLR